METAASFAVLFIGLAFFLFVMWWITSSEREDYVRQVREMREFGFRFDRSRHRKNRRDPD